MPENSPNPMAARRRETNGWSFHFVVEIIMNNIDRNSKTNNHIMIRYNSLINNIIYLTNTK